MFFILCKCHNLTEMLHYKYHFHILAVEPHDELDRRELRVLQPGGVGEHDAQLQERDPQVDGGGGGRSDGERDHDASLQPREGAALQRAQSPRAQKTHAGENVRFVQRPRPRNRATHKCSNRSFVQFLRSKTTA